MASVIRDAIDRGIRRLVFSYDSNCSYSVNLFKRLGLDPEFITQKDLKKIRIEFVIPKFHLGGHKPECADRFSLNYKPNVGRLSGEGVETPWASFNGLQYSAREMSWGNRRDFLNDHLNWWNWMKVTNLGAPAWI